MTLNRLKKKLMGRKNQNLLISLHGNAKMVSLLIKKSSLLRGGILNSEKHSYKKVGTKMTMYGLLTLILSGLPRYLTSIT